MEAIYTTAATAKGGRNGHVSSDDGILDLEVRIPKEMGGQGGYTNPEQLFAAGYAACFESAINHIAREKKIKVEETMVTAEVSIGKNDKGGFALAVKLHANIKGVTAEVADELVKAAHETCPYSNATRGNIDVELKSSVD
ncbi:organic hydroperoxide resistance protein [Flavobacterium zepuense]|uniref:Organic hydroperoxide resistance protein n=1 Tax=Flavobacterium zepuense TaxID=2593302 RepID=A0A552UXT6_9FLAO|nr:organic hydroperoxide resistance protein [Flavobacterium zepuense]TRW23028.1 organic hydroperoxide resistance protein [Flavobacterium zepuense]